MQEIMTVMLHFQLEVLIYFIQYMYAPFTVFFFIFIFNFVFNFTNLGSLGFTKGLRIIIFTIIFLITISTHKIHFRAWCF